jgi:hypothetical protein
MTYEWSDEYAPNAPAKATDSDREFVLDLTVKLSKLTEKQLIELFRYCSTREFYYIVTPPQKAPTRRRSLAFQALAQFARAALADIRAHAK